MIPLMVQTTVLLLKIGIMKVCEMDVNIENIPSERITGRLGNRDYAKFEYKLRLTFGDSGVLGFSLESMDGQQFGHAQARYSFY